MKPSNLHTPRSLAECNFVHGYGHAKPDRDWCAIGHRMVTVVAFGAIAAFVVLVWVGAV